MYNMQIHFFFIVVKNWRSFRFIGDGENSRAIKLEIPEDGLRMRGYFSIFRVHQTDAKPSFVITSLGTSSVTLTRSKF